MSKLRDRFRAAGIFNTYQILERFAKPGRDVACLYHTSEPRSCMCHGTKIFSPSHKTDPGGAWYNYDCKFFIGRRVDSMLRAIAWASKKYGIAEWDACPMDPSARIPREVRQTALKFLKEHEQTNPTSNSANPGRS